MRNAHANWVHDVFPHPANSLSINFNRYHLIKCEGIPLRAPRVHLFQQRNEFIVIRGNNLAKTPNRFAGFLCHIVGSASSKRDTFYNLIEAEKAIESAVA